MKRKPFAPEWTLIDEHATQVQPPLQETKIRVPKICTVCHHYRRRYHIGVAVVHRESYWHIGRLFSVSRLGCCSGTIGASSRPIPD
jgi:hypothetical protein